jgi:hypothetical protein
MSARTVQFLLLGLLAAGCNPDDEAVFKKGGNNEGKPVRSLLNGTEGLKGFDATAEAKLAASVTYIMKVTSESDAAICEGEATVEIKSDFSMGFPKAEISCASLKVNLAKALDTGGAGFSGDGKAAGENISHDGKVLSLKKLGKSEFDPPRPMLLGPIVQDASKYKGYKKKTDHTISGSDAATGQAISGTGSFTVEVLDHKTTYKNKFIDDEFTDILHWQMSASGFKGIPARNGLLFDKMEWFWNTRPIMIPKISISGYLSDFISGEGGANTDALVGLLKIDLVVKEYKIEKD